MNSFRLINAGFGNMVMVSRIVAVISPESAPVKRMIQDARARGAAVDATCGRRTRAVIMTDCDTLILSALQPETLANRVHSGEQAAAEAGKDGDDI